MAFSEFPTVAHQLYQLAGGERTALELTRRSLAAIEASQPTLNAFRVVLAERALVEDRVPEQWIADGREPQAEQQCQRFRMQCRTEGTVRLEECHEVGVSEAGGLAGGAQSGCGILNRP